MTRSGQFAFLMRALCVCGLLVVGLAAPTFASERGPVTNLPLPRFVSLKVSEGNMRRGPSLTHKIDWSYQRRG